MITHKEYIQQVADINPNVTVVGTYTNNKTAQELNDKWELRKTTLEELGYNVVFIWEQDYRNQT